jgi:hypothetical protein
MIFGMRPWSLVLVSATVLCVAALELAAEFIMTPPPSMYSYWYSTTPIFVGMAMVAVSAGVVRHPAFAALAFLPVAIKGVLDAGGYRRPWHEVAPVLNPGWPVAFAVGAAVALGLLLGAGRGFTRRASAPARG